jgi:hypothetical protein
METIGMFIQSAAIPCVCVKPGCCRNKGAKVPKAQKGSMAPQRLSNMEIARNELRIIANTTESDIESAPQGKNRVAIQGRGVDVGDEVPDGMTKEAMDRLIEEWIAEAQKRGVLDAKLLKLVGELQVRRQYGTIFTLRERGWAPE